ncbi:MAG: UDP-glucose 4-epimerase GalE [Candidatus Nanopelagicaceae bacterium]
MRVLVTGGAGYIGSTAVAILLERGYEVNVLDDCSTGHADAVSAQAKFVNGSILDIGAVSNALKGCDAVIHFAAKSLVGESVEKPDLYEDVNVNGTRILLAEMAKAGVRKLVFSSTAATYGEPEVIPITEDSLNKPTSPYGTTKLAVDQMITAESKSGLAAISLRYFNVAGAFESKSGWLAERHDPETHLIPNLLRATAQKPLKVFGNDWPTKDGTCIRDYVHVVDLIDAHILALENLEVSNHKIINLGSGGGYSVTEVIDGAAKVIGREIPAELASRRSGDPAVLIADISKAKSLLGWSPKRNIEDMVGDTWKSQNASTGN